MNVQERIDTVVCFINQHKNSDLGDWGVNQTDPEGFSEYDKVALLKIYTRMCRGTFNIDMNALTGEPDEFCIEISRHESSSTHAELFEWEDAEMYQNVTGLEEVDK
ncbi:MAG: hypothetical protein L3J21_09855 [Devosiaceae bacterium]|nr:hypothetical protein [Devosiaceae bacterium]